MLKIIKNINRHPLAGRHRWRGYYRLCRWQLLSRLAGKKLRVKFTSRCSLWVKQGMTGATGNIYMGLHDFPEMAFLLHFLRSEDRFVDVGANIGSYTVLASAHIGCRSVAFEPVPDTFQALLANISLNGVQNRVMPVKAAVGARPGILSITASLDTVNHVIQEAEAGRSAAIRVPVVTVDDTVGKEQVPALVKIDVEGFEWEVLQGMQHTLANRKLKALIIELNGSGERYGYSDKKIHKWLLDQGFRAFGYDPFKRDLTEAASHGEHNTIYLRDLAFVRERLKFAPLVTIFGETF